LLLVVTKGKAPICPNNNNNNNNNKINFFLFFGNEFSFSDYYLKTYFKKERNEREIEKEKEKECKFF